MNKLVVLGSVNADHVLQVASFLAQARRYTVTAIPLFLVAKAQTKRLRRHV